MRLLRGWRPQLRLAWRDAVRSKGRSVLVLVMIALPVMAVAAADIAFQTQDVSGAEALDRRLGTADARVSFEAGVTEVLQRFDPDDGTGGASSGGRNNVDPSLATISEALGRDVHGIERREGVIRVTTDKGVGNVDATELDLTDPLATGMWELTRGVLPTGAGQIAINQALANRGFAIGDDLEVLDGPTLEVVGLAESTGYTGRPMAVAPLDGLGLPQVKGQRTFLVAAAPISWDEVRELNGLGATVLSRAVVVDPPPETALPLEIRREGDVDEALIAVVFLIVAMTLLEVVLLAGPAFAVGARRHSRNLALMAAAGGTPQQTRRVVLASGIVLGGLGAGLGVLLGIVLAAALLPVLQRFSDSVFGPFDVPWTHLAGIALFGLASAFLAAVVPAWIASRQDVVAVLAGRRGDRATSLRSPIVGLLLLGVGVAGSAYGTKVTSQGELFIAGSAALAVLGMILLVPVVVVGLARVSRSLPLVLRYAVRDAARHRTRTVPAVAAVAATVAGVVALGIANASDEAENEATYSPSLPMGHASLSVWTGQAVDWDQLSSVVRRAVPDARVSQVRGLPENPPTGDFVYLEFREPGGPRGLLDGFSTSLGSSVLVSERTLPPFLQGLDATETARAEAILASGGVVVFTSRQVDADEVKVVGYRWSERQQKDVRLDPVTAPAMYVQVEGEVASAQAVAAPSAISRLGIDSAVVALHVDQADISIRQETDVREAVGAVTEEAGIYVERGYQPSEETTIVLLVLGALGGVLMLGGTLTATFLALSDARPDLATFSAVGASTRTRRGVASAYALVVGLVGAILGAVVGFIPGIAITYPLTSYASGPGSEVGPFLDVPWLLIGSLVVALPLLTALIVGMTARSRLPLVARLD